MNRKFHRGESGIGAFCALDTSPCWRLCAGLRALAADKAPSLLIGIGTHLGSSRCGAASMNLVSAPSYLSWAGEPAPTGHVRSVRVEPRSIALVAEFVREPF